MVSENLIKNKELEFKMINKDELLAESRELTLSIYLSIRSVVC